MNYLSKPYQPEAPIQRGDLNVDFQVLNTLQSRYDANKAIVDQAISQYEMLRGLRDTDNEYIASKITEAKAQLESFGNIRFEHRSSVDGVLKTLQNVVKDPIVMDAVKSKAVYDSFNTEVSKKKEKNDGTYSDLNYQDALEQGGFYDYMEGKSNSLKGFNYTNYTDVNGKLDKKAKEYVELMGKEMLLDQSKNEYYIADVYGKRVYMKDIYQNLQNSLDNNDLSQLRINARQTIGKLKEADKMAFLTTQVNTEIKNNNILIAEKQASLSNQSGEEAKATKLEIEGLKNQNTKLNEDMTNNSFDLYSIYNKTILNGIADSYDINYISKIDYNDIPLEIAKFKQDQAEFDWEKQKFQIEYEQKEREISSIKEASPTMPITNEKPYEYEAKKSDAQILTETFANNTRELRNYLMSTNENGFKEKTEEEQNAYIVGLKTTDVFSDNYSKQREDLVRNFQTTYKSVSDRREATKEELRNATKDSFDALTNVKLDNLQNEMPLTAKFKRENKTFDKLSENEQSALMLEFGSNYYRHGDFEKAGGQSKDVKHAMEVAMLNLKSTLDKKDKGGYLSTSAGKSFADRNRGVLSTTATKFFGGIPIAFSGGTSAAPFTQDTDITEIDTKDDATINVSERFNSMSGTVLAITNAVANKIAPTLRANTVYTYSPEIKEHKLATEALKSAILNVDGVKPAKDSQYSVEKAGDKYRIYYQNEDDTTVSQVVEKLPSTVQPTFSAKSEEWSKSLSNPNVILPNFKLNVNNYSTEDMYEKLGRVANERPDLLPTETYINLFNRGSLSGTPFETREEFLRRVITPDLTQKQQQDINNLVNADYSFNPTLKDGKILYSVKIELPNNAGKLQRGYVSKKASEVDNGFLQVEAIEQMVNFRNEMVNSIINKND